MVAMKPLKVLIADDDAHVRELSRCILRNYFPNLHFDEAENGKTAQEKLVQSKYDFILSDWEMPHLSGYDLLQWVRVDSGLNDIPFILVSSRADKDSILRATRAGASAYIIKPFSAASFIKRVTEVVDKLNRRQFQRFSVNGAVDVHYNGSIINGEISDISRGGFLGIFGGKKLVPTNNEKVLIDISLKNNRALNGLEGFIHRVQSAGTEIYPTHTKIAFRFHEIVPEGLIN